MRSSMPKGAATTDKISPPFSSSLASKIDGFVGEIRGSTDRLREIRNRLEL